MTATIDTERPTVEQLSAPKPTGLRWLVIAVVAMLVGIALAGWIVSEVGIDAAGPDRDPVAEPARMSEREKLADLANRGLIPSQALVSEVTVQDKLADLANRGLIPAQALVSEMTVRDKLVDLANRGLIPRQAVPPKAPQSG